MPTSGDNFELARHPRPEDIRDFDGLQPAARREHDIDQDLEALGRKTRRQSRDRLALEHEEAAHGIADGRPGDLAKEPGAELAQLLARRRQADRGIGVGDARSDREIAAPLDESGVHLRQDGFVMLKIAVDHRDEIGARSEPAFDHRAGQAEPIDAAQTAQSRIAPRDRVGDVGGAIGQIVIDDDHLPRQAGERRSSAVQTGPEYSPLRDKSARRPTRSAGLPARRYRLSSRPRSGARRFARRPHRGYGRGNACVKPRAGTSANSTASSSPRRRVSDCGGSKLAK